MKTASGVSISKQPSGLYLSSEDALLFIPVTNAYAMLFKQEVDVKDYMEITLADSDAKVSFFCTREEFAALVKEISL